jgi:hypothetical protein
MCRTLSKTSCNCGIQLSTRYAASDSHDRRCEYFNFQSRASCIFSSFEHTPLAVAGVSTMQTHMHSLCTHVHCVQCWVACHQQQLHQLRQVESISTHALPMHNHMRSNSSTWQTRLLNPYSHGTHWR